MLKNVIIIEDSISKKGKLFKNYLKTDLSLVFIKYNWEISLSCCKKTVRANSNLVEIPFDLHKLEAFSGPIAIVKEQLLPEFDVPLGKDSDPVVTIDQHDPRVAVRVYRVVREADLIAYGSKQKVNRLFFWTFLRNWEMFWDKDLSAKN